MWYNTGTPPQRQMFQGTKRKDLTGLTREGVELIDKWVSADGDFEVHIVAFEEWYSVTALIVEIPEVGETIEPGDEYVEAFNLLRTKDKGRALAKFAEAVAANEDTEVFTLLDNLLQ